MDAGYVLAIRYKISNLWYDNRRRVWYEMIEVEEQIHDIAVVSERISPIVVVCCIAFNHEGCIRETLEGFVMQKTNFPFIVIVHDDASVDRTPDIIREYVKNYPELIHPMYETENQYSKGNGALDGVMNSAIRASKAKYVAVCEGDDYWVDPLKLQKQVEFMEGNQDYSMCFTNAQYLNAANGKITGCFDNYNKSCKAPIEDLIMGGGGFCATASIMIRTSVYLKMTQSIRKLYVGDYAMQVYSAFVGKVYYIDDVTAVYRVCSANSWTSRNEDVDFKKRKNELWPKHRELLNALDDATGHLYSRFFRYDMRALKFWDYCRYEKYMRAFLLWPFLYKPFERYGWKTFIRISGYGWLKKGFRLMNGRKYISARERIGQ